MYQQIKKLADEAIALQNKDRMDAALREISAICAGTDEVAFNSRIAVHGASQEAIAEHSAELAELNAKGSAKPAKKGGAK